MKRILLTVLILGVATILTGCAHPVPVCPPPGAHVYGFWAGLWHGWTLVFSFIGSLFDNDIVIYATNNNGGWYDFGYFIGVGGFGTLVKILTGSRE